MSYGLVCLNCRSYIWHESLGVAKGPHFCQCSDFGIRPQPSLDARTEATPGQVQRWWASHPGGAA